MDDAALEEFLDCAFEFLCERKLGELVSTDRLLAAIDLGFTDSRIAQVIARFVVPARQRLFARAHESPHKLGEWIPPATKDALAHALGQPMRLPHSLVDEVVRSEKVQDAVRAMLQEAVSGVMQKGVSAVPIGGKGMAGALKWGARAAGAAGRGLFGGLGDEIQRQIEDRVRDVVDGYVGTVQSRIAQKLTSPETARMLGKRRRQAFLDLCERTEREAGRFVAKGPHELFDAITPALLVHNLARAEVRDALREEIDAVLTELGKQTLGELLVEYGLKDFLRGALRKEGLELARAFLASPQFARWKSR
jgi:hypothetical protein